MTAKPKCECKPGCNFAATEGEPYFIMHDPRPERQAARSEEALRRSRAGVEQRLENRSSERDELVARIKLDTLEGQLAALNQMLGDVLRSNMDAAKRAIAVVNLVKAAREVIATSQIEQENKDLKKLIDEKFPELRKHLKAVP